MSSFKIEPVPVQIKEKYMSSNWLASVQAADDAEANRTSLKCGAKQNLGELSPALSGFDSNAGGSTACGSDELQSFGDYTRTSSEEVGQHSQQGVETPTLSKNGTTSPEVTSFDETRFTDFASDKTSDGAFPTLASHGPSFSIGSSQHNANDCKPCAYYCFSLTGCRDKDACTYCHLSHVSGIRKKKDAWKKDRAGRMRKKTPGQDTDESSCGQNPGRMQTAAYRGHSEAAAPPPVTQTPWPAKPNNSRLPNYSDPRDPMANLQQLMGNNATKAVNNAGGGSNAQCGYNGLFPSPAQLQAQLKAQERQIQQLQLQAQERQHKLHNEGTQGMGVFSGAGIARNQPMPCRPMANGVGVHPMASGFGAIATGGSNAPGNCSAGMRSALPASGLKPEFFSYSQSNVVIPVGQSVQL